MECQKGQNPRIIVRSREVLELRDSGLDISNRSEIWQAPRQQRCRDACQISERYDHYNIRSRDFWEFARSCGRTSYRLVNSGMFTAITNFPHLPHNYTAPAFTNPSEGRLFLIIVDLNARGTWWQIGLPDHIATQRQIWFLLVLIHRYPICK